MKNKGQVCKRWSTLKHIRNIDTCPRQPHVLENNGFHGLAYDLRYDLKAFFTSVMLTASLFNLNDVKVQKYFEIF